MKEARRVELEEVEETRRSKPERGKGGGRSELEEVGSRRRKVEKTEVREEVEG